MNKKRDLLGIMLATVAGAVMLGMMLTRAFLPQVILPKMKSEIVIIISLLALIPDYYFGQQAKKRYLKAAFYSFLIFSLFPWAACFTLPLEAIKLGTLGGVIFTVITVIFDSITKRIESSPASKIAPVLSAFGLYLASGCLTGII